MNVPRDHIPDDEELVRVLRGFAAMFTPDSAAQMTLIDDTLRQLLGMKTTPNRAEVPRAALHAMHSTARRRFDQWNDKKKDENHP